jgi:hypothetical protein
VVQALFGHGVHIHISLKHDSGVIPCPVVAPRHPKIERPSDRRSNGHGNPSPPPAPPSTGAAHRPPGSGPLPQRRAAALEPPPPSEAAAGRRRRGGIRGSRGGPRRPWPPGRGGACGTHSTARPALPPPRDPIRESGDPREQGRARRRRRVRAPVPPLDPLLLRKRSADENGERAGLEKAGFGPGLPAPLCRPPDAGSRAGHRAGRRLPPAVYTTGSSSSPGSHAPPRRAAS